MAEIISLADARKSVRAAGSIQRELDVRVRGNEVHVYVDGKSVGWLKREKAIRLFRHLLRELNPRP